MVKETEYYDLLCVEVTATDEQIKKAYRKQALKYHPDRPTGDTEKFKELSTAFQILSHSNKREIYDKYGKEGNPPEKETVDASDFFDSVFGGGAFKTYLGDVNFFSGVPEDFGMDEPQQPTDVSENPTDQECTDVVNDNFAQGIDFNVASDQEIKNFVKAQKEMKKQKKREMEQQRREIQKKKDEDTKKQIEEMTSSLNTLIDDYFLYQRQNREEEYIKKIQKEANLLKVESFGLELIHLIGSLYVTKAENFIKANKTFGFSRVVTGFIDKKNMTKDAYGVLSSALELQKASANQGLDLDNEYLTAEQQAEMEGELMPKILKTMWLVLKMESTMKVRKTCDNILKDSNLSKKERLERANVLVLIGKIFKETTRTKEEQEESQMFEDMIMKNKLK